MERGSSWWRSSTVLEYSNFVNVHSVLFSKCNSTFGHFPSVLTLFLSIFSHAHTPYSQFPQPVLRSILHTTRGLNHAVRTQAVAQ